MFRTFGCAKFSLIRKLKYAIICENTMHVNGYLLLINWCKLNKSRGIYNKRDPNNSSTISYTRV